jgi:hypothetical protein
MIDAVLVPPEAPIKTANPADVLLPRLLGLPAADSALRSWTGDW